MREIWIWDNITVNTKVYSNGQVQNNVQYKNSLISIYNYSYKYNYNLLILCCCFWFIYKLRPYLNIYNNTAAVYDSTSCMCISHKYNKNTNMYYSVSVSYSYVTHWLLDKQNTMHCSYIHDWYTVRLLLLTFSCRILCSLLCYSTQVFIYTCILQ